MTEMKIERRFIVPEIPDLTPAHEVMVRQHTKRLVKRMERMTEEAIFGGTAYDFDLKANPEPRCLDCGPILMCSACLAQAT